MYYIAGNGGFSKELLDQLFDEINIKDFGGFLVIADDKLLHIGKHGVSDFNYPENAKFVIGTTKIAWRQKFINSILKRYPADTNTFPNMVAKSAHISKAATVGVGNVFGINSAVSGDPNIGNFNCISAFAFVGHDVSIGNNNVLHPYACIMGGSSILNDNVIESKGVISDSIKILSNNTVSAGECVFEHMTNNMLFQSGIQQNK